MVDEFEIINFIKIVYFHFDMVKTKLRIKSKVL